ncbi:Glutathione S-transferase/chloride channel, C-terminal [Penicillium italicum]|uniref:Glutathione S-transferase/chloride channel, C-terminal n=1 Tax=Penicillium italicum TaxID=40296 RepID=A0A0A2LQH2_PENIT|nr:Glutathione S-transferase/chloride channel, C-terminal [Penicillium italicum]
MAAQTPDYHLIGLYTRYSSWTARVEAVLEYFQIPHTCQFIQLSETKAYSPTGLVPILQCHSLPSATITDSLAICEFLAESNPTLPLWPKDRHLRALARSAAAQMHSGFPVLRNTFHTNFLARYTGNVPIPDGAAVEIARLFRIWDSARKATTERLAVLGEIDEGFLFGGFSIADAFFWPILWRFRSYGLSLEGAGPDALAWMAKMWSDPVFKALGDRYYEQAEDPQTCIAHYDDIFRGRDDVQYGLFPRDWTFSVSG